LQARFGADEAQSVIAAAVEAFQGRLALVSSFGAEAAVLLKLVSEVAPRTPVLFLDTGKHFVQTLAYRRRLAQEFGLRDVRDIHPDKDDLAATDPRGDLWRTDADQCCALRKVRPLDAALAGFDAWITGRKQFHGGARAHLPAFEASGRFVKINPIARWSPERLSAYAAERSMPPHPLVEQGYPSIGCWPCTHPVAPGDDLRAGRWRGSAKTECGIHVGGNQPSD
jgi:phosphoadenosine phosphosulfate reductase